MTLNASFAYAEQTAVPETLRLQLRTLWLKGAKTEDLAATFKLPLEWLEDFVLEGKRPRPIN
jgi:hypothetical protein